MCLNQNDKWNVTKTSGFLKYFIGVGRHLTEVSLKKLLIQTSLNHSGPFYKHWLTLIPAWTSNHKPSKVWDEIIHPFLNFNGCTVEVEEWISNYIPHFIIDMISMHVGKMGHREAAIYISAAMYIVS